VRAELHAVREGSGEALVLLHPVGLDVACWEEIAAVLRSDFEVVRLDLPGHGSSCDADPGLNLRGYAEAVGFTLDRLGIVAAHIAGLSFGGMVAQTLAIEHPEMCASLIAAGCPCTMPAEARPARAERGRLALREGMAAVVPSTLERWFTADFIRAGRAEPTRRKLLRQSAQGWHTAWEAISRLDTLPGLKGLTLPCLCIAGELDQAAGVEAVRLIAQSIPGARFEVLSSAPHMMQLECPAAFTRIVREFLAQVPSRAPT
jgi:3-oxoadipate enol-lactonase